MKRIVGVLGLSRSAYYYQTKLDDTEIIKWLDELIIKIKPNRGIDSIMAEADEKA